jgi:hypothetical protein
MTTTAHDDQYAPEPDPVFETRAELEAWAVGEARYAANRQMMETRDEHRKRQTSALHTIRRVTLAHLHLKD